MGHKDRSVHLATVSGVASTKPEIIRWMEKHGVPFDIFTTKSYHLFGYSLYLHLIHLHKLLRKYQFFHSMMYNCLDYQ